MKAEPLKGKILDTGDFGIKVFHKTDVKKAVEWLKECIHNHNWSPEEITKSVVVKLIDEAFEDITKSEKDFVEPSHYHSKV